MTQGRPRLTSGGLEWPGRSAVDRSLRSWPKFHLKINFKETSYGGRSTPRERATAPPALPGSFPAVPAVGWRFGGSGHRARPMWRAEIDRGQLRARRDI